MTKDWRSAIKFLEGSIEKENELIKKMDQEVREVVASLIDENNGVRRRAQHAKMLAGFKNAEFRISPDIPEDLRVGFLKPGAAHLAYVRFSNASGFIRASDAEPDLRGVAIKIKPSAGADHDFLMTNAEEHHAKDAYEAMSTSLAFSTAGVLQQLIDSDDSKIEKIDGVIELVKRVGPIDAIHILLTLKRQMNRPIKSLAMETYWSRAPLRVGEVAVKYLLGPTIQRIEPEETCKDLDLGQELRERLEGSEIHFDFQVQRYIDESETPLENARKEWKSEPETIAQLVIPQQNSAGPEEDESFFESMSFNPWHINTGDFEPLGSMNRARKIVYPASVDARQRSA